MKIKIYSFLFLLLFSINKIKAQEQAKHSIYAPLISWEVINPNFFQHRAYFLKGLGYQYHLNTKWAFFAQGHHKAGTFIESGGDSVKKGDLKEWNFKIGAERKWQVSQRWKILTQLALFKENQKVDNGIFEFVQSRPWDRSLNWMGVELLAGAEVQLSDRFSLFLINGIRMGRGKYHDTLFNNFIEPGDFSFAMEWSIIENFGIKYSF